MIHLTWLQILQWRWIPTNFLVTDMQQPVPIKAGIGLRGIHHDLVAISSPKVAWWEVHTENFFAEGGAVLSFLRKVAALYPISFHGVGLSLGSADLPDLEHLRKTKNLVDEFKPGLVSEHISWGHHNGINTNELLPLPYNSESLEAIARNIDCTQNFLGRQILVENPSAYIQFAATTITEPEFIAKIIEKTKCGLLLDVNNIYVSCHNNKSNTFKYIEAIDPKWVQEIHLAGHIRVSKNLLFDTHSTKVCDDVWELYEFAIRKLGPVPTLIEWDADVPALEVLQQEAEKAQTIMNKYDLKMKADEPKRVTERIC